MGLLIAAFLISRPNLNPRIQEDPKEKAKNAAANNKFRKLIDSSNTLSVQIEITQKGNPALGHAELILKRPDKLYYHLDWGKAQYTYTVLNGEGTEVDQLNKVYDEYAVPGWTQPAANGSDWMVSYFPTPFVSEKNVLPARFFDDEGHLLHYSIGSGDQSDFTTNTLQFTNYVVNSDVPDSKFKLTVPAGYSVYGTPRPAPPFRIGATIPDIELSSTAGRRTKLLQATNRKPALLAYLDPTSEPCVASISVLRHMKGVSAIILDASSNGAGFKSSRMPVYFDPKGGLDSSLRAPMTPLFYLIDGKCKVLNVWYGFDRDQPEKFSGQLADAVKNMHG